MKRILLSFAACLMAVAAFALSDRPQRIAVPLGPGFIEGGDFTPSDRPARPQVKSRAEASQSIFYTPAYDPQQYISLEGQYAGLTLAQAFQMTSTLVDRFDGNSITEVFFYTGLNQSASKTEPVNTIKNATLFLAYDLQKFEPFYTQTVELPATGLTFVHYALDTPCKIEAGKPLYVGYYYTLSAADDLTVIIDLINHGNDASGGWFGIQAEATSSNPNPQWQFDNVANQVGFLCLGAVIAGDNLPQDEASIPGIEAQPTVYQGEGFDLKFMVKNHAANDITSIDVDVTIGDNAPTTSHMDFSTALGYDESGVVTLSGLRYDVASEEEVPVKVTLTKVNGNANKYADASAATGIQVIPTGKGFQRNVLVEEFTGTWCGYCPIGIVTMEKLREKYTDGSVIPVAIHYNDEMAVTSFSSTIQAYSGGSFPSAVMNRQFYIDNLYPTEYCMEEIESYMANPAPARVTATANFNEGKTGIIFNTKTSFAFDNDKASDRYILHFVVTEDNVGPYMQENYYSGGGKGEVPGWSNKPGSVETVYNDVARQYNSASGVRGSVPESVEAGKEYEFSYEMKFLSGSKISNKDNLNGIVYLVNRKTNVVENACIVKAGAFGGIDGVIADGLDDADAPVEYFNMQGMRVAEPANGIFIRRQGAKAEVVVVK